MVCRGKRESLDYRIGFCIVTFRSQTACMQSASADVKNGDCTVPMMAVNPGKKINDDIRSWDRGDDFAELKVDPKNKDVLMTRMAVWKSLDGGKVLYGFKGAPGGR